MPIRIKRTGHLVLRVKDLERSKRFFSEILGLPLIGDNGKGMLFSAPTSKTTIICWRYARQRRGRHFPILSR